MSNLEKRTFTTQEIKDFIGQWKESGLSKKKFADQHGLKYYTFIAWFEKHGRGDKGPGFEQIQIGSGERIFAEVVTGKMTMRFYQVFPKDFFSLLLQ